MMCKTFMESTEDWDLMCYVFVWTIRTTAKVYNQHFTPYETITGMKPRSPLEFIAQPWSVISQDKDDYVSELVRYMKHVHEIVQDGHALERDQSQTRAARHAGAPTYLNVGEYCYVKRQRDKGVSERFQPTYHEGVFQVVETHGDGPYAKTYTVCNSEGSRENLGFSQPVASERLKRCEMLPLEPVDLGDQAGIIVYNGTEGRKGVVTARRVDGSVYVKFADAEDDAEPELVDLTSVAYSWST